jgi:hypothetical protein
MSPLPALALAYWPVWLGMAAVVLVGIYEHLTRPPRP